GVAQVGIGSDDVSIAIAAKYILSKSETEIKNLARDVLVHHLQAIVGMSTLEQINTTRDSFAIQLQELSTDDLANMGLVIHSLAIKHIRKEAATLGASAKR
ncbi:MAG: flotillin family protein, partial [Anaerolineae bacterium]